MAHKYSGSFVIDEQFFNDFDYSGNYRNNEIDMDKLNYSLIDQQTDFYKKKFPLLEDSVVALIASMSLKKIEANKKSEANIPPEKPKKPKKPKKTRRTKPASIVGTFTVRNEPSKVDFS